MDENAAFMAAIRDNPDDDTPRLVFADWCDDRGEPDRAEFIRGQVEIARALTPGVRKLADTVSAFVPPERVFEARHPGITALRARSDALLAEHELDWLRDWPLWQVGFQANSTWVPEAEWAWDRGFVGAVALPWEHWVGGPCPRCEGDADLPVPGGVVTCDICAGLGRVLGHAAAVVSAQPVTRVTLTNREPGHWPNEPGWPWGWDRAAEAADEPEMLRTNAHVIPLAIWNAVPVGNWLYLKTRDAALAALSRACVAHGRAGAGLPPLR